MIKSTKLFLVATLCIATSAVADIADDVRCKEIAFSLSVEKRDVAAFSSFIDVDARFVGGSISRGPVEVTAAWSVFFADDGPEIKWRPQYIEVLEDGKLALSRGPYRMITRDPEGKATEHWGTFNSVWRTQTDGTWKIVFDAGSESAEAPSEDVQALLDQDVDCQ
jgi:ketosteroid isomerase-like protein